MHEAAAHGHDEVVRKLLTDDRVDIDGCTFETLTPLILAAEKVGLIMSSDVVMILYRDVIMKSDAEYF